MPNRSSLVGKQVIMKISGATPVAAKVVAVDNDGFWFSGKELIDALLAKRGAPSYLKTPAIYVPISHLDWIVAAVEDLQ